MENAYFFRPCKNQGTCIDHIDDFMCVCEPPYTGKTCENEMDPCVANNCSNGATCTPTSNFRDYVCTCPLGFTGRFCNEDIDECKLQSPCRNGGECLNTPGSYTCHCRDGFEGRDCLINTDDCAGLFTFFFVKSSTVCLRCFLSNRQLFV